jgi:FkbM family methyltransferase
MLNRMRFLRKIRDRLPSPLSQSLGRLYLLFEPYAQISFAQEGEDMALRRLLERETTGFYVDVGAHHPKRFSNTYYFYLRGWRGINVEPNPDMVALLRAIRPRDINIQVGVSDRKGTMTYHQFSDAALNTFDEELAKRRENFPEYTKLPATSVPVRPLADILAEHLPLGAVITFLSIDAEGHDLRVLASNDWIRFRPRIVVTEAIDASLLNLAHHEQTRFLADRGYSPVAKTGNTLIFANAVKQ